MRLTLRTLLAWLDDTLSPTEVREIGKQVSESPFAQELIERIQRVTRQRRLTVPSDAGPEAVDPNLVASYLDNELDPDLVPEFEKLCLTSDVHMAEVASVHQILSLIGQKAKVPDEARKRMYHLVRGREAIARKPVGTPLASSTSKEPVVPWETPEPPGRPWISRFGPAAAAIGLIAVLSWSAWKSLSQTPQQTAFVADPNDSKADRSAKGAQEARKPQPPPPGPVGPTETETPTAVAKAEAMPEDAATEATAKESTPPSDLAPGMVGMTEKSEGVLLRYSSENRQWESLREPSPLKAEDRLLSLDPFRSTLVLGRSKVDLVGETEVWLNSRPPTEAARFHLAQGRMALFGGSPTTVFEVQFAGRNVLITPPNGSVVGVERLGRFEPGQPETAGSVLRLYATEGEVKVAVDDVEETLNGPGGIVWNGEQWTDKSSSPPPTWVTEAKPTPFEVQIGELFLKYFRPERSVVGNMVEALEDEQKDVRRLAIRALRAVGGLSYIVPVLNRSEDPVARREAIRVLRATIAQGPDALKALHEELGRDFGEAQGALVEKLLIGYSAKEARDENTFSALIQQLSSAEVGIRELALDNLRSLTGRDDLEYDPDNPEGRGLRAWTTLLRNHELRPTAVGKTER